MPGDSPVIFLDFDGTITRRDTTDAILEAYADPRWLTVEENWIAGRIGSRECLQAQMALVDASTADLDAVLDAIPIDEGFVPLLEVCAARGVPLYVLSDGFDYCIRRVLSRLSPELLAEVNVGGIFSSRVEPDGRRWRASFPAAAPTCGHGCATCKPELMARLNPERRPAIYVGDGLSDRHAARAADLLFAKTSLATYCDAQAIPYLPYENLASIAGHLEQLFVTSAPFMTSRR